MTKPWLTAFCLALLLTVSPLSIVAQSIPRALHWETFEVTARLDEGGRLHVRERHEMVFSGDWNGGERSFRLGWDDELELEGIHREDPETHSLVPLTEDEDPPSVDRYAWHDSKTLRWRSRSPSDPPFRGKKIVYVLDYTLENVLIPTDDGYLLDHDFAFPDRPGPILSFSLELSLDEALRPKEAFSGQIRREKLMPGESVVLTVPLDHMGEERLEGIRAGASGVLGSALAVAFAAAVLALGFLFYRQEDAIGRFEPLIPLSSIGDAWLEENVFSMLPEEVGAAWDDSTAAPEVAAVLARMVSQGKLRTEVYRTKGLFKSEENLRMELLVDRNTLKGYESSLVRALFVEGDVTDTVKTRKHYESRGFDPASKLRDPLKRRVARLLGNSAGPREISRKPALLLLGASALALAISASFDPRGALLVLPALAVALFLYLFGFIAAAVYRKRVENLFLHSLPLLIAVTILVAGAMFLLAVNPLRSGFLALASIAAFVLSLTTSLFNAAKFRDGGFAIAARKKLASARRYFAFELAKENPRLDDRWFPYLLAFELGPNVDRWFRAHGGSTSSSPSTFSPSTRSEGVRSSGDGRSTWTGGGGAFGGAGATGSWAAAVGSVATGVAAPSSGGSGGSSSGGGGGSSGGGGGGGW
ncbi:MAG: DUF2207 domain-containing protein [Vicinamibacteria bacterium]